jgi:hypothetical protein
MQRLAIPTRLSASAERQPLFEEPPLAIEGLFSVTGSLDLFLYQESHKPRQGKTLVHGEMSGLANKLGRE